MPRLEHEAGRLGKTVAELEAAWTPIGRLVEPYEIGPLAVYLASREASAVTGQAFNIDGGLLMV
jgi:NAD(P)-dependent dehydrogenase (short-subunit alcohol dehydrogenase family)